MLLDINFPSFDDSEDASDSDQVIPMEAIGMDISIVQDTAGISNSEEEASSSSKWTPQTTINEEETTMTHNQITPNSSIINTDNNIPSVESITIDQDESHNIQEQSSQQSEVENSDTEVHSSP